MHPNTDTVLRPATADDASHLAAFARMAGHGLMELFYQGLLPDQSLDEIIIQRRIAMPGSFNHWQRWVVAENSAGAIMGGLNAFPHDVFDTSPPDPLLD